MYSIVQTKKFSKSLKRLVKGGLKSSVVGEIKSVIDILASGKKLSATYLDHKLKGELSAYRECHIQGDLLLVYQLINQDLILILVDVGSHNDLF